MSAAMQNRPPELKDALTWENAALLFAAVTGLAMAIGVQLSPHGIRPVIDERTYINWAREIASGHFVLHEPFYNDPLPAYLLGFIFFLSNGSLLMGRLFYVCLGVCSVALIGVLARTLFGKREGRVAMWLLALYGPHTFAMGFMIKEVLAVHLTLWALLLGVWVQTDGARARTWAALGFVCGALVLCRGNFVPLVPLVGLWAIWRAVRGPGELRARRNALLAFCVCVALPPSLATAHNLAAAGSWMPITTNGGAIFFIGNNPYASGTFDKWEFSSSLPELEKKDYQAEAERRTGTKMTAVQSSNYWRNEGLKFWKEQPAAALRLLALKSWLLVHDYEIPDTYAFTCFRTYFTPVLWVVPVGMGALLGLALVGAFVAIRADRRARFPAAFFVLYGGAVVMFLVFDRYRLPLCTSLCLFASHALVLGFDRVRRLELRGLWKPALAIAAATAVAFIPTPISKEHEGRDAFCVGQAGLLLYSDGLTQQAAPYLAEARRRGGGATGWLDEKLAVLDAKRAAKESPAP